jgi:polysaccharide deacetylase 2 family uncharacterized protein YibQ
MAGDDLDTPLGRSPGRFAALLVRLKVPKVRIRPLPALAVLLALALGGFGLGVAVIDNPLGGEPHAVATLVLEPAKPAAEPAVPAASETGRAAPPASAPPAASGQTITIIDATSGQRREVTVPGAPGSNPKASPATGATTGDPRVSERSRHGMIPAVGADGAKPIDVYSRRQTSSAEPAGPAIALILGGLGVGATLTGEAIAKLPGEITLAFAPYGIDLDRMVQRARSDGHEVLLHLPLEPVDYPDNDPGPQTLLSSLSPEQNIDRLHWLMSRFSGYVGVLTYAGARFTANEPSLTPIMREIGKRGLLFIDDGQSTRSLSAVAAGSHSVPFAKADLVLDTVPTPSEIDGALRRLEALARERGQVIAVASALPVTIDRIAQWSRGATERGFVLLPASVAAKRATAS